MKRSIRIVFICILAAAALSAAALCAGAAYLVSYALDSASPFALRFDTDEPDGADQAHQADIEASFAWLCGIAEDVYVENDGLALHGYLARRSEEQGARWLIAVHGYKASAADMAPFAEWYWRRGWNVLVIDQRAHGLSEGRWIGMGVLEKNDLLGWIDMVIGLDSDARIALHGVSMGAATVMLAAGEALPQNVRCIIEDCGYSSVAAEFSHQLQEMFHLPPFPLIPLASAIAELRAGWSFSQGDALAALRRSQVPLLCIHGSADTFVPFSMLDKIYEAAPGDKVRLIVRGAEHARARDTDPNEYWTAVSLFTAAYV